MPPQSAQFDPNATYQPASAVVAGFDPNANYAPAPASSPGTASSADPKPDPGLLEKAWDWANRGLISGKGLVNIVGDMLPRGPGQRPGESAHDFLTRQQNTIDPDHPYINAIKVGLAGADKDVADAITGMFTSPLGLATLGAGGASKVPGAAGKAARAMTTIASAGFAGKGAGTVYNAATDTSKDIPTRLQEGLEGAAMVAGGAGGATESAPEMGSDTVKAKALATAPVRFAARTAETALNQKLAPIKPILRLMTPADEAEAVHVPIPGRDLGLPPKPASTPVGAAPAAAAPTPKIPTTAGEQSSLPLVMGEHLGEEAAPAAAATATPAASPKVPSGPAAKQFDLPAQFDPKAAYAPAKVESLLNDSLGGKPLEKNVPLRQQVPAAQASTATSSEASSSAKLPEGFTPTESSVLAGYKYDPATQEFESITNRGQHYIHGEVSPDQAAKFEAADSKGRAWNELRGNSVLVAKVLNGVRKPITGFSAVESGAGDVIPKKQAGARTVEIDPETGRPEFSDVIAARKAAAGPPSPESASQPAASPKVASGSGTAASGEEDLTAQWQKALDQVNLDKGAVHTTAAPADLAKRWGVDNESLAAGREQTRGMSPEQTEQYIAKLVESYKKGTPVEPVMETRDANNNIIEVDGRARAIAAGRAGVKRIPIIVRRLKTQ